MYTTGEDDCSLLPTSIVHQTGRGLLGHGAYSDVLEVTYKEKVYAAKKYRILNFNINDAFSREHEILTRIRHPNIVPYYGICKLASDKSTVIVMERMDTDLATYLKDDRITLPIQLKLLYDVANGLHHLHSQMPAIIHRDLTAANVLLTTDRVAKICDFGNSRIVDIHGTPELLTTNPGTQDYMPPEAVKKTYNDRLDVFSYGHLAIHIIIKRRPYPIETPTYEEDGILIPRTEVQRRKEYLDEVSHILGSDEHPLYHIMVKCLQNRPLLRPSCKEIIANKIFEGFRV